MYSEYQFVTCDKCGTEKDPKKMLGRGGSGPEYLQPPPLEGGIRLGARFFRAATDASHHFSLAIAVVKIYS